MCWKSIDKTHEKIIIKANLKKLLSFIVFFLILFFIDFSVLLLDGGKGGFGPEIETEHTHQLNSQYDQIKYYIVTAFAIVIILSMIVWIIYWLICNLYIHSKIKNNFIEYEDVTEEFIKWAYDNKIHISQEDKFKAFAPLKWSTNNQVQYFCIRIPLPNNKSYKYQFFCYNKT